MLVVSAAMITAVACGGGTVGSNQPTRTVRIILGHLRFAPAAITVKAGTTVHFILANSDAHRPRVRAWVRGSPEAARRHADARR